MEKKLCTKCNEEKEVNQNEERKVNQKEENKFLNYKLV